VTEAGSARHHQPGFAHERHPVGFARRHRQPGFGSQACRQTRLLASRQPGWLAGVVNRLRSPGIVNQASARRRRRRASLAGIVNQSTKRRRRPQAGSQGVVSWLASVKSGRLRLAGIVGRAAPPNKPHPQACQSHPQAAPGPPPLECPAGLLPSAACRSSAPRFSNPQDPHHGLTSPGPLTQERNLLSLIFYCFDVILSMVALLMNS
jgi:hypothetical protein